MARPLLITLEKTSMPILIIDWEGSIGLGLYTKLSEHYQTVLVGGRQPEENKNLLFLPFKKQIPQVPSDTYSEMFYIVSSENELKDILHSLSEKAKIDKAKLFVIGSREVFQMHIIEYIYTNAREAAIIVLGDMFGNPLPHLAGQIDEIFLASKTKKRVKLSGLGLAKIYPVFFDDVIVELIRLSFTFSRKGKLYFLHTQYPITSLGLAHILQKDNPLLKIDFNKDEKIDAEDTLPIEGEYLLPEDYPASEKLQKAYFGYINHETPIEISQSHEQIPALKKSKAPNFFGVFFLTIFIFILTLVLMPLAFVAGFGILGQQALKSSLGLVQKGDVSNAKKYMAVASQAFSLVSSGFPIFSLEANTINKKDFADSLQNQLTLAKASISDATNILDFSDTLQKFTGNSGQAASSQKLIDGISAIKNLIVTAEQVSQDQHGLSQKTQIISALQMAPSFINVLDGLPAVFGAQKKETYLVLFQNNAELRPGGGFIGSYGILQVDKGMITDFSIHDVYDADGQLKGHIEPPFAIRRYMQIVHLFLRDSNFDVDFSQDAFMEAFMYQQEVGQKVDGVIAVDLTFVKDLIASVGSVYVPSYNETVTKDNFFLLTEKHAEKNFFPGSTQKTDFLKSTFDSLKGKLLSGKIDYLTLLEGTVKAAQEKDILLAFANSSLQDLFTVNNLSSTLWDPRKEEKGTINDFLGINEANIGINKVNYYVTRKVSQQVAIGNNGEVSGKIDLTITNNSDGTWPGGSYKNYLRFILPQESNVTRIVIDGQEQKIVPAVTDFLVYEKKGFVPPAGLEVEKTTESGKALFAFLTTILPKKTQVITVYYTNGSVDVSGPTISYNLLLFKQPGVDVYPYSLTLQYPNSYKLITSFPSATEQGNAGAVQATISQDRTIAVTLAKR